MSYTTNDLRGHGWDELREAWGASDADMLASYALAALYIFTLTTLSTCMCCCSCNAVMRMLEASCCMCRCLFRMMRRISSFVLDTFFCRRCWGTPDSSDAFDEDDLLVCSLDCNSLRTRVRNQAGRKVRAPYCQRHWDSRSRQHAVSAREFETATSKYTLNLHYRASKLDVGKELCRVAKRIDERPTEKEGEPGYIYIYHSSVDEAAVPFEHANKRQRYMFKIGHTTQDTARKRVKQQDDAVFVNIQNVGWWSTGSESSHNVEQMIFALLVNHRMRRVNSETGQTEVEWFLVEQNIALDAIKTVVELNGDYSALTEQCTKKE